MEKILISSETIKLSQLLKLLGLINTGGEAKYFLLKNEVFINTILCSSRNKLLKNGDILSVFNKDYLITVKK